MTKIGRIAVFTVCGGALAFAPSPASAFEVVQLMREERATRGDTNVRRLQAIDDAAWIGADGLSPVGAETFDATHEISGGFAGDFFRFSCEFESVGGEDLELDVSADERFVLLMDGEVVARGPHRGMVERWYYQSYRIGGLSEGKHLLEAVVWRLGPHAPLAQLSWRGGSLVVKAHGAYDGRLTTGKAEWRWGALKNTRMTGTGKSRTFGAGSECEICGTSFLDERPADVRPAAVVRPALKEAAYGIRAPGWMLFPTERRDPTANAAAPGRLVAAAGDADFAGAYRAEDAASPLVGEFSALWRGGRAVVAPGRKVRLLWDLGDYYCAYPELAASGGRGARIRWGWTESLRGADGKKGDRGAFAGKNAGQSFVDSFVCDGRGGARFTAPWWRCGRWCQLTVETADEPLAIDSLRIVETRCPMEVAGAFSCDDETVNAVWRMCRRTMECCQHEMLFDCPFYEQQMYPGDTRNELLTLSALTAGDAMAKFAMTMFDCARRDDGMVPMNFPTRGTQESATYTMSWLAMFRDYAMRHRDAGWLRARLPGARNAASGLLAYVGPSGLVDGLPGWNFSDWTPGGAWPVGVAPGGRRGEGPGAFCNLMLVYALQSVAEAERALGNGPFADAWLGEAERLRSGVVGRFWSEERGMLADDSAKTQFSEQVQSLAILTHALDGARLGRAAAALAEGTGLVPCSSFFAHYLFNAYAETGRADLILKRLDLWRAYLAHGAKTAFETASMEARSDCHAWSACPIYWLATGVAGIAPAAPFFRRVRVAPQPAGLGRVRCRVPHPDGVVEVDLSFAGGECRGSASLPPGVSGEFVWRGRTVPLAPGVNVVGGAASAAADAEIRLEKPAMRWLWGGFGFHNSEATMTPIMSEEFRDQRVLKTFREISPTYSRVFAGYADWTREAMDRFADYYDMTFRRAGTTLYLVPGRMPTITEDFDADAYAENVATRLKYLIKERKCTKIRYYTASNELSVGPTGAWFKKHWDMYVAVMEALYRAFRRHGLDVGLMSSDASGYANLETLDWSIRDLNEVTDTYCWHLYSYSRPEGKRGSLAPGDPEFYNDLREALTNYVRRCIAKDKRLSLGEWGVSAKKDWNGWQRMRNDGGTGFNHPGKAANVAAMTRVEMGLCAMNAGCVNAASWTFCDYPDPFVREDGDTAEEKARYDVARFSGFGVDVRYNKWGLFRWDDETRDYSSYPDLYAMGYLVKLFRKGSRVLKASSNDATLRIGAVTNPDGSCSIAAINWGEKKRARITSEHPIAKPLRRYVYESANPPFNAFNDLQPVLGTVSSVDGVAVVELPEKSITFLTTDYQDRIPSRVNGVHLEKNGVLAWDATEDAGHVYYRVYRDGRQIASTVATSLPISEVSEDAARCFSVRSVDQWGNVGE